MNHLSERQILINRLAAINEMNAQFNELVPKLIEHFKNNEPRFKQDGDLFKADRDAAPFDPVHEHKIRMMLTSHNFRINLVIKTTYTVAGDPEGSQIVNYVSNWHSVYNDDFQVEYTPAKILDPDAITVYLTRLAIKKAKAEKAAAELKAYTDQFYPLFEKN